MVLELEVAELQSLLCKLAARRNPNTLTKKMTDGYSIVINLRDQIYSHRNRLSDGKHTYSNKAVDMNNTDKSGTNLREIELNVEKNFVKGNAFISDRGTTISEKNGNSNGCSSIETSNIKEDIAQIVDDQINAMIEAKLKDPLTQWILEDTLCRNVLRTLCISTMTEIFSSGTIKRDEENEEGNNSSSDGENENSAIKECIKKRDKEDNNSWIQWCEEEETFMHMVSGIRY